MSTTLTPPNTTTAAAKAVPPMEPFIDPRTTGMREFTWRAVIVGTLLGMVFGASSLYLVLKVGLTVSASIPVAVISLTIFRALSRVFGHARRHDPRTQHHPDRRLGGRIHRLRRRRDDARDPHPRASIWN